MDKTERDEEMINSLRMIIQNEKEKNATLRSAFDELYKMFGDTLAEYKQAMNDQFDKRKKLLHELHEAQSSLAIAKHISRVVAKSEQSFFADSVDCN